MTNLAWPAGGLVVLLAASSALAAPLTKDACVDANTSSQEARRAGKLREAREKLRLCVADECPSAVRQDCATRLEEVDRALPTLLFVVKDASGNDLPGVKVAMDGQPLEGSVSGATFEIDPGEHKLSFAASGLPTTEKDIVVREGEKGRRVEVTLGAASTAPESTSGAGTRRIIGLAVGGVGVVGLGLGTVFGLMASSQWSNVKSTCGGDVTHCGDVSGANSRRTSGETDATISTMGFIAGGALLAGGAVLFFTAPKKTEGGSVAITPIVGPGQGGLAVRGAF